MRILIYGLNFAPELVGVGKYTGEMAEWLAARGHEVRAVTAPPFHPARKVAPGFSPWHYAREDSIAARDRKDRQPAGSLTLLRCPLWIPLQASAWKRTLHLASFVLTSFPVMLRQVAWKPDVVMAVEPTLLCAPAALLSGRFSGARTWLHVQDFEADAGFALGLLKSGWLKQAVTRVERKLMSAFGRVSTISEKMLARLEQKGVSPGACRLFPNWVDTEAIFPLRRPSALRGELGIPVTDLVTLYAGTMAHKQGLEVLAETAGRLAGRQGLRFVFCGEGPGKPMLANLSGHLVNVQWIPLQSLERLNDLLNLADIHLLPQRADAADLVMPSKLTGMLASGRPVVAAARRGTQLAQVVEGRGVVVEPENAAAMSHAIELLASNPGLREELGKRAREYALSELRKEIVLSRFEQELLLLVAS